MKVVADTSILIDFLRAKNPEKSIFYRLNQDNYLIISLITAAELFSGKSAQIKSGREKLNSLFEGVEIRIPDMEDAFRAGEIRYLHQLTIADAFVASLALKLNIKLATLDQKAFKRIKNLKLYQIN